jgi:hypothetical protein
MRLLISSDFININFSISYRKRKKEIKGRGRSSKADEFCTSFLRYPTGINDLVISIKKRKASATAETMLTQ